MKKHFRWILIITALLLLGFLLCGKVKLKNEYDFFYNNDLSTGKYKFLAFWDYNILIEGYKDFYIDDIETLLKMQKQWVFKYQSEILACGWGYRIFLVDDNNVLNQIALNIDCEYLDGWIYFPKNFLTDHVASFKRMSPEQRGEFEKKYNIRRYGERL